MGVAKDEGGLWLRMNDCAQDYQGLVVDFFFPGVEGYVSASKGW
jgi:hypothetical protein